MNLQANRIAGLLGEPVTDRENFVAFHVLKQSDQIAYVYRDVLAFLQNTRPTPEGDYLFFVEGYGRLRFRLSQQEKAG